MLFWRRVMQIFDASEMTFMTPSQESLKIFQIVQYSGRVISTLRRVKFCIEI